MINDTVLESKNTERQAEYPITDILHVPEQGN
jgi:hypothetical protein